MTFEEIFFSDPCELLLLSEEIGSTYPPVVLDSSVTLAMSAHGNVDTTLFALRALLASVQGTFELLLVDDVSPDCTGTLFERVAEVHNNTRIFRFSRNMEYSGSLNTILSHATGRQIIFISNDIFITPAWVQQLLSVAKRYPAAGIVRGCANFVDNGLRTHNVGDCSELDNFDALFCFAERRADEFGDQVIDDPFLTGDAFLVTREVISAIGYIDQRFYGYFADHDFGIRARRAGFRPKLACGAFAWHQHGSNMSYLSASAKDAKMKARWGRVHENWARFKDKFGLPVSLEYSGIKRIPWDFLAQQTSREVIAPCDSSDFCVPEVGSYGWKCHKAQVLARYARSLVDAGQLTDAERMCGQALEFDASSSEALNALGTIKTYQGKTREGISVFRKVVKLHPADTKAHSNLLLSMHYQQGVSKRSIYLESKRWEKLHGLPAVPDFTRTERSRIRIAFVSPDFRRHAVSCFFMPLLEHIDYDRFEVFCISDVAKPDEVTGKLSALADGWRDIYGLSNDESEKIIREIAPDILIDLAGHTGQVIRLPIFSRRLAPVQVTWLGYPDTTGLEAMDYRLTDTTCDPPDSDAHLYHSERLVSIDDVFLCFTPPAEAPEVSSLPAHANGYVTFGCFNMLPKIQDDMISVWCRILRDVPGSKLILKNHYFRDDVTSRHMLRRFAIHGIDGTRVRLLPSDPDLVTHLSRYSMIDIALDTFPYNGTTTTCEALWMGVPLVTLSGDRHASRVGKSLLDAVGLNEMTALTPEQYFERASFLATDLTRLSEIRGGLRFTMENSVICSGKSFAAKMDSIFTKFFRETCRTIN